MQPIEQVARLRDALYAKPELLDAYLAANPDRLVSEELGILASWRHRLSGEFYVMRHLKAYTVFMNGRGDPHLYGVLDLHDPLEAVLRGAALPLMVRATLLPFRDRIIYDGILSFYSLSFGPGIRSSMKETYNQFKEREGIIESLVSPDGQPQIRTSLTRKAPAQPAPDWRPAIDEIVAQTEKMRQTNTKLQSAAFGLLRAVANLAQATLQEQGAQDESAKRMKSVHTAVTKIEKLLYAGEW